MKQKKNYFQNIQKTEKNQFNKIQKKLGKENKKEPSEYKKVYL